MRRLALAVAMLAGAALAQAPAQQWEPYSPGLQSRAAAGDANAQFVLGEAYRTGNGIAPDREAAIGWYRKASARDPRAADALGVLLFTKGERQQAIPLLQAAAARRNDYALYILGTARFNGDYVPKDIARASADLRLAAATLPQAQRSLGLIEPYMTPIDRQRADSLAAQVGGPEAGGPAAPTYALAPPPVTTPPIAKVKVAAAATATGPAPTEPAAASADVGPTAPATIGVIDLPPSHPVTISATPTPSTDFSAPPTLHPTIAAAPTPPPRPAVAATPKAAATTPAPGGNWRVQLGAYASEERAAGQWAMLSGKVPALARLSKVTQPAGTGMLVRLQATRVASREAAKALCQSVTAAGGPCLVLGPVN